MKIRKQRHQPVHTPLKGLLPILLTWLLIPAYLYLQPVILHQHLVPFIFYVGLINAYSVGQMITAHLVKDHFPYGNVLVIPLVYGLLDSLGPAIGAWPSALGSGVYQVAFVFLCLGLSVGVYGSFVVSIFPLLWFLVGKGGSGWGRRWMMGDGKWKEVAGG